MKGIVLLFLFTTILLAQSAKEVELTDEPHHRLTFSNREVRVFDAQVPAHTETLMHWHRHDYVFVAIGDAQIVNTVKGKSAIAGSMQDGDAEFVAGGFAHATKNVSDRPLRVLVVELLQDERLRKLRAHDDERALEILHGGTEEVLWMKDGVRASEVELQAGAMMPAAGKAALLVAVSDVSLQSGRSPSVAMKIGESRWFDGTEELMNTGSRVAKFVVLEFTML